VLSQELHHRVKNVITLAASIVQQTGRNVASTSEYQSKVTDRLLALGRAQDLLITTAGEGVPLSHLLDQILAPFDVAGHLVHPIRGPAVTVPHALAVSLSLLLNELATNATKYGALSVAEGRLEVSWRRQSSWTWLEWTETQGPTVAAPTTSGFGSRLFLSALPQDLGLCEIVFDPAGVRCRIGLKSEDLSKDVV
jgi:two-component sensor histidine kinase